MKNCEYAFKQLSVTPHSLRVGYTVAQLVEALDTNRKVVNLTPDRVTENFL